MICAPLPAASRTSSVTPATFLALSSVSAVCRAATVTVDMMRRTLPENVYDGDDGVPGTCGARAARRRGARAVEVAVVRRRDRRPEVEGEGPAGCGQREVRRARLQRRARAVHGRR